MVLTFSSYYVYYPHIILFDDGGKETANLGFPSDKELYYQPSPFAVSDGYIFQSDTFHATIFAWPIGGPGVAYGIPETKTVQSMAVDASGNLYVLTGSSQVAVYQPGVAQPSRTIADGIHGATLIAVDGLGYLYAGGPSRVSVYASGSSAPAEIIKQGVSGVVGLAIGGKERLYVANLGTNAITAYTFGKKVPSETITAGLGTVGAIAVGPTGTLYAVAGSGAIAEYDKGGTTLSRTAVVSHCQRQHRRGPERHAVRHRRPGLQRAVKANEGGTPLGSRSRLPTGDRTAVVAAFHLVTGRMR